MKNLCSAILIFLSLAAVLTAQNDTDTKFTDMYESLEWREIGPFRGGRSAAVTGVPGKPLLYYMGATGGGVWRTKDGGRTWENISDGFFGGSVGSVAVSESDNNVIYVGGGEVTVRGNVSYGYGVHKSVDAGKTWDHVGLSESRHIPRMRIHPANHDVVFAAVLGDLFKSSEERGIYKSSDGGETWRKVLFVNEDAGAVDLVFDPSNPRIMYASTWRVRRQPHRLDSGGEGSGLWKSTDSGETWTNISSNEGLPDGVWGISGVTVSPVNPDRVWAIIENAEGGVYRSDDAGETWKRINQSRALRQRAWYYSRIYADTEDENVVYVMNVRYHKSKDGGKTFEAYNAPHGDHHDLWIAPEDSRRMIIGDDGGAQVSFDGGENWSTYHNQPTAQFYRVTTDDHFPYRIYAAQQDNSTIRIAHRTNGGGIGERDWEPSAGGESAHLAVDPQDNEVVYGGSYGGFLTRYNHRTEQIQAINVWPDNPMGHGAENMKYRFQWNFPIFFSPHDPNKLYTTSNHVHVSYDRGQSWEVISPDLTRNDSSKLVSSGGPITQDNTGVEYYCTIFAAAESPREEGLIWTGSDDGLIHISRDGGENWENVTPPGMPEWTMINSIEVDPHNDGGLYVAATRYKLGDYAPYLYKTNDYGESWELITTGIEEDHFTRVVRADPEKEGLLYAGTETGMYISFDDGANWQPFQQNLPIVPITDLAVKDNNLIAATQGRSLWIIDDLTLLHQVNEDLSADDIYIFEPVESYAMRGGGGGSLTTGTNHPGGVNLYYYLPDDGDTLDLSITFYEADGDEICTYSSTSSDEDYKIAEVKTGAQSFRWNMQYPGAKDFDGRIFWWGSLNGPRALPGKYVAELKYGDRTASTEFTILADPRSPSDSNDLKAQFEFINEINQKVTEAHEAIIEIREIRKQMGTLKERIGDQEGFDEIIAKTEMIDSVITDVERSLYQTQNESRQDPLNFPIKLTNKLAHVNSLSRIGNFRPTEQAYAVKEEMEGKIDAQLQKYYAVKSSDVAELNRMVSESTIKAISLDEEEEINQ